jgi:hypothetical protein
VQLRSPLKVAVNINVRSQAMTIIETKVRLLSTVAIVIVVRQHESLFFFSYVNLFLCENRKQTRIETTVDWPKMHLCSCPVVWDGALLSNERLSSVLTNNQLPA